MRVTATSGGSSMGIFNDVEKKMADETAAEIRKGEQQKAQLRQVAYKVSEELTSYMGTHPRPDTIDISVEENVVALRKRTTGDSLEIKCERDDFVVNIDG